MNKLAISVTFLLASCAFGANLLVNPGFETGDFTGWVVGGTAPSSGVGVEGDGIPGSVFGSTVGVKEGTYAAWGLVRGFCCTPPEFLILSQTISVTPGADYTIGFFGRNQSSRGVGYGTGDPENHIQIYVDGLGLLPSAVHAFCPLDCFDPARGWIAFESTFNAGASSSVTVDYRIIASGTGYVGLSLDDFYVIGDVPEPATWGMAMLALSAMALRARRWRKG